MAHSPTDIFRHVKGSPQSVIPNQRVIQLTFVRENVKRHAVETFFLTHVSTLFERARVVGDLVEEFQTRISASQPVNPTGSNVSEKEKSTSAPEKRPCFLANGMRSGEKRHVAGSSWGNVRILA